MICGIDEAGRGSLCGSLFVAAVACKEETANYLKENGIKDSKKLSKNARANLYYLMQNTPEVLFLIIEKTAQEIDSKGLSICLKESLLEIINTLSPKITKFYFDGNSVFHITPTPPIILQSIIKGDSKMTQISAASVMAKYAKDREMEKLHQMYPAYNLLSNAGYGTKDHLKKIALLGQTPHHRKSFVIKSHQSNITLF